jgi:hypothetical protein
MEDLLVHLKETIYFNELELEVDYYNFISIYGAITSTTLIENFTTKDVTQQWTLLSKQKDFVED